MNGGKLALLIVLFMAVPPFLRADDRDKEAAKAIEKLAPQITRDDDGQVVAIDFRGTKVADADLKHLKVLKSLQTLYLGGTQVSDAGLKELKDIKSLRFIGLLRTQVTEAGVKELRDALPGCNVTAPVANQPRAGQRQTPARGRRIGNQPAVDEPLPTEVDARVVKIAPGMAAFYVPGMARRGGLGGVRTAPLADDAKVYLARAGTNGKLIDNGILAPDGLANQKLKAAYAGNIDGLSAHIRLDKEGQKILEIRFGLSETVPKPVIANLQAPSGPAGMLDTDPLPPHALARFGSTRFRHGLSGPLAAGGLGNSRVAISPDGQFLATCESDTVQLWNLQTGERLTRLNLISPTEGPASFVGIQDIAFSPDSTQLAVSRGGGKLQLLTEMGRKAREYDFGVRVQPGMGGTRASRLGPDDDANTINRSRKFYQGPTSTVLAFLPGAKQLLVNHENGPLLRLLDLESGKVVRTFGNNGRPNAVALSADGRWLAFAEGPDGKVKVLEIATGKQHSELPETGSCTAIAFSPDSKVIATASTAIQIWDCAGGKPLPSLQPPGIPELARKGSASTSTNRNYQPEIRALQFSPNGKQVLAGYDFWVVLWDYTSGKEICHFEDRSAATVRFLPDGKTLLLVAENTFRLVNAATGKPVGQYEGHQSTIESVALAPDGKRLATGNGTEGVRIWDTQTGKIVLASPNGPVNAAAQLVYSPRGDALVAAGGSVVVVWDCPSGQQRVRIPAWCRFPPNLVMSPDGMRLAFASYFNWATQVSTLDGAVVKDLYLGNEPVGPVAFSPDLRLAAARVRSSVSRPGEASFSVWDYQTGKVSKIDLSGTGNDRLPLSPNDRLLFSPDGRTLLVMPASGSARDPRVFLLELPSGETRSTISLSNPGAVGGRIQSAAFSPNGRFLAPVVKNPVQAIRTDLLPEQGRPKHSVRIIDLPTGQVSEPLIGHESEITSVSFSADSKLLATGSHDTTAMLWDVAGLFPAAPAGRLSAGEQAKCWSDLGGDAQSAYRSMWKLADDPASVALLRKELKAASSADGGPPATDQSDERKGLRAVEVLEWMNTKEARNLLATLAKGQAGSSLTLEAERSLARLRGKGEADR